MKRILLILLTFIFFQTSWSQVPNKMSYQAVVRDASNVLVANQNIGIKISVLQGSPSGASVYEETHTITSNSNGLVSLVINEGQPVSGNFSTIFWTDNTYFIKNEIDINGGTNYTITGVQQIFSVPYAIHAKTADNFTFQDAALGEMLYFNGSDWVSIPAGEEGQAFTFCNGKPTWGVCIKTTLGGPPSATTANVNGSINTDGSLTISEKGICYSTSPNPTITDLNITSAASGNTWGTVLSNLTLNTTYYAKSYIINSSGIEYGNEISFTTNDTYGVGDYYPEEGGVVFYILKPGDTGYDPNTSHGLIVSLTYPDTAVNYNWGCQGTYIGTSTNLSTGSNNTNLILENCTDTPIAATICEAYSSQGFEDWYLGSRDEIALLGQKRHLISATLSTLTEAHDVFNSGHRIWTSSQFNLDRAFYMYIRDSSIDIYSRDKEQNIGNPNVRPIRSF